MKIISFGLSGVIGSLVSFILYYVGMAFQGKLPSLISLAGFVCVGFVIGVLVLIFQEIKMYMYVVNLLKNTRLDDKLNHHHFSINGNLISVVRVESIYITGHVKGEFFFYDGIVCKRILKKIGLQYRVPDTNFENKIEKWNPLTEKLYDEI